MHLAGRDASVFDEFCKGAVEPEMKRIRIGFTPFEGAGADRPAKVARLAFPKRKNPDTGVKIGVNDGLSEGRGKHGRNRSAVSRWNRNIFQNGKIPPFSHFLQKGRGSWKKARRDLRERAFH